MTDQINIPENDPDLILAKQYGKVLAGVQEDQDINDPIYNVLVQARSILNQSEDGIHPSSSEHSWDRLQKSISESESRNKSNILPLFTANKWYWAAAAVVLIAFTSIFLLRQVMEPDLKLIAESGATISVFELADGSSVTLRPNSRLFELPSSDRQQSYSLNGEALFQVASKADRVFSVEAGPGRVVVTGTRFNLSDRDDQSTVHLLEGSVVFETANRLRSVNLIAGQAAVISNDYMLEEPFNFETDEITGWTQSRLTFRNRQLAFILSELEFHYNITIQAPSDIAQITLGGSVALDSPEQSLQDLGIVLGGEFVLIADKTYQFRQAP
jgi:ferric-dicitrate binding protein FerR (iron transport regulator)